MWPLAQFNRHSRARNTGKIGRGTLHLPRDVSQRRPRLTIVVAVNHVIPCDIVAVVAWLDRGVLIATRFLLVLLQTRREVFELQHFITVRKLAADNENAPTLTQFQDADRIQGVFAL